MKKFYFLYKITNLVNDKVYIGVHSTDNLYDGYMGSGKLLQYAYSKYGIENFKREILYRFSNEESMYLCESIIVDETFKNRSDTYNLTVGGKQGNSWKNKITVKDKDGKTFQVAKDDPRYLSGELVPIAYGRVLNEITKELLRTKALNTVMTKDSKNNIYRVSNDDPRYLSGELISIHKNTVPIKINNKIKRIYADSYDSNIHQHVTNNKVTVKDKDGNTMQVSVDDPRYLSGELVHVCTGMVSVRDKDGNTFQVSKDDPRYLNKELISTQSRRVNVIDKYGNRFQISADDPRYLNGELSGCTKGQITVRDKDGKCFNVLLNDKRYLNGELLPISHGKFMTIEHREKLSKRMSKTMKNKLCAKDKDGNKYHISKNDPRYLSGELVSIISTRVPVKDKDGNKYHISKNDPRYLSGELVHIRKGCKYKVVVCPHCGKEGDIANLKRWHFDNCKHK